MLIELQKRKCLRCGHVFTHPLGGFVLIDNPPCPVCRATVSIVIGSTPYCDFIFSNHRRHQDK